MTGSLHTLLPNPGLPATLGSSQSANSLTASCCTPNPALGTLLIGTFSTGAKLIWKAPLGQAWHGVGGVSHALNAHSLLQHPSSYKGNHAQNALFGGRNKKQLKRSSPFVIWLISWETHFICCWIWGIFKTFFFKCRNWILTPHLSDWFISPSVRSCNNSWQLVSIPSKLDSNWEFAELRYIPYCLWQDLYIRAREFSTENSLPALQMRNPHRWGIFR